MDGITTLKSFKNYWQRLCLRCSSFAVPFFHKVALDISLLLLSSSKVCFFLLTALWRDKNLYRSNALRCLESHAKNWKAVMVIIQNLMSFISFSVNSGCGCSSRKTVCICPNGSETLSNFKILAADLFVAVKRIFRVMWFPGGKCNGEGEGGDDFHRFLSKRFPFLSFVNFYHLQNYRQWYQESISCFELRKSVNCLFRVETCRRF